MKRREETSSDFFKIQRSLVSDFAHHVDAANEQIRTSGQVFTETNKSSDVSNSYNPFNDAIVVQPFELLTLNCFQIPTSLSRTTSDARASLFYCTLLLTLLPDSAVHFKS
jgi:hypothetical protein